MSEISFRGNIANVQYKEENGQPLLDFAVAENHSYLDREKNQWIETGTTFHNCAIWGDAAKRYKDHLQVGAGVLVVGIQTTKPSKQTDENGKPKYQNITVNVRRIGLTLDRIESVKFRPKQEQNQNQSSDNEDDASPFDSDAMAMGDVANFRQ